MRWIWELAGIVGVDPGPLTLRELLWMYAGRRREEWVHTAHLLTLTANCHRGPRRRAFVVADFLPADLRDGMRRSNGLRLTPSNLRLLKPLFDKKGS